MEKGVLINWGLIDTRLYCTVTSGHITRACNICQSLMHASDMYPSLRVDAPGHFRRQLSYRQGPYDRKVSNDSFGRSRIHVNGVEACNNFNYRNCTRGRTCHFGHFCIKCKEAGHGISRCESADKHVSSTQAKASSREGKN